MVELLTVIAIIGLLAGLVLGIAGYATAKSDRSKAVAQLEKLKNAVNEYRVRTGTIPNFTTATTVTNPAFQAALSSYVPADVLNDVSYSDPWGNAYLYMKEGPGITFQYKVWSTGPNSLATVPEDDIQSWTGQQ